MRTTIARGLLVAVVVVGLTLSGGAAMAGAGPGLPVSQQTATQQNEALMQELKEKIRRVEYLFQLEMFGVYGCLAGAALGTVTGVLHFSGVSTLVMPYISTGCAFGFLVGPAALMTRDYLQHFFQGNTPPDKAVPAAVPPSAPVAPQPPLEKQGESRPGPMGWGRLLGDLGAQAAAG